MGTTTQVDAALIEALVHSGLFAQLQLLRHTHSAAGRDCAVAGSLSARSIPC
jgi:hypothetical protein